MTTSSSNAQDSFGGTDILSWHWQSENVESLAATDQFTCSLVDSYLILKTFDSFRKDLTLTLGLTSSSTYKLSSRKVVMFMILKLNTNNLD
jgi:hypothetical protein